MPIAEREDNRILLSAEYREREMLKQIPGIRWEPERQTWWLPLSWAQCVQLRHIFGQDLQIGTGLNEWAKAELASRIVPCMSLRSADDATDMWLMTLIEQRGWPLKPFQRAGVAFLATARQALLADEMGLGKTVQAICALEAIGDGAYPALVVCPNSMKHTWKDEFAKWAPARTAVVIAGTAVQRRKAIEQVAAGANVAIINFESLRGHTRLAGYPTVQLTEDDQKEKELNAIPFKTTIADEAHRIKDPRSKQTRALWHIGWSCENRFALTGTPLANSPVDLWTLGHFVVPYEYPTKTRFIERYAVEEMNIFGFKKITGFKAETTAELFKFLDPRFIRRLKAAVLPQLPPKTYSERYVEMGTKQKQAYKTLAKEMMAELDSGVLLATSPLTRMTRLVQFASAHGDMGEEAYDVRGLNESGGTVQLAAGLPLAQAEEFQAQNPGSWLYDVTPLVLTEPSCKADALEEILCELGGQRALVFAESRQLIEVCAARLVKAAADKKKDGTTGPLYGLKSAQVTGMIPDYERQTNVNEFNAGNIDVLLMTLGAGGEGLSFPGCSTAIFLQRSFNAVLNLQAEDRIHGIGRGEEGVPSAIIDVITEGTIEYRVHAVRDEKAEIAEELYRDKDNLKEWLK